MNPHKKETKIFSIGYGGRDLSGFVQLLKQYGVQYLVDVRSKPYSKFNPDFSQRYIENELKANAIRYVFMGDLLGGLPSDQSCFTNGRVDYNKCKNNNNYHKGINRILVALEKNLVLALMCSEAKPEECHRSKLLGMMLADVGVNVLHIDENGGLVQQSDIHKKIYPDQLPLIDGLKTSLSNKVYISEKDEEL